MTMIDPEQERRRLAEFYSHQMDGELEKVAAQGYELTDIAREALRAEMSKRGLSAELVETAPAVPKKESPSLPADPPPTAPIESSSSDGAFELRGLVTIRQFRDLPEALLAKGSLESAGVQAFLGDDNIVRMDWLVSNAVGGIKLQVESDDVEAANRILEQPILENFDVSGVERYEQPHCPKCGSLDVNFRENQPAAYLSMALSVPIPLRRKAWRCHSCDTEWEDDGVPGPAESSA